MRCSARRGSTGEQQPPLDTPLLRDIGFHEHTGRHAILATDWKVFLDFADAQLRPPAARPKS